MLSSQDRANAVYQAISSQATFQNVTQAEVTSIRAQLAQFFAADTTYLTTHAQVNPGTLNSPAGQAVATPSGPGATSAPQPIAGVGTLS